MSIFMYGPHRTVRCGPIRYLRPQFTCSAIAIDTAWLMRRLRTGHVNIYVRAAPHCTMWANTLSSTSIYMLGHSDRYSLAYARPTYRPCQYLCMGRTALYDVGQYAIFDINLHARP